MLRVRSVFCFLQTRTELRGGPGQGLTVGGTMESKRTFLIVTNNPLVAECVPADYAVDFENITYREILVKVRDLVYAGHRLYTHPLSRPSSPAASKRLTSSHPGSGS